MFKLPSSVDDYAILFAEDYATNIAAVQEDQRVRTQRLSACMLPVTLMDVALLYYNPHGPSITPAPRLCQRDCEQS